MQHTANLSTSVFEQGMAAMENIIETIHHELDLVKNKNGKIITSDVRKISAYVYRSVKPLSFAEKLDLCENLLEQREWALGVVAYDIAYKERKHYTPDTFHRFENWLMRYVRGWGDCDDFCTHAFGALLAQNNHLFPKILAWCQRPEFWMRRAAAVSLIYPINKYMAAQIEPFKISDALMNDDHDLVLKGYGWMLKVYGTKEPALVAQYLSKNAKRMPRVSFRYALEKFDDETKRQLMAK